MKHFRKFSLYTLPLVVVLMTGCAATSTSAGTGGYIDDTVITSKVKLAILNEPSLKTSEINVETFKSVVQLSGFVSSSADKSTAVTVARAVKGVTDVKNDMHVK